MRALLAALALIFATATPAAAERFALDLRASTLGVFGLGDATLDFDVTADRYLVRATLQSRGLLQWFEPTQLEALAEGRIQNGQVQWERYTLDHRYSKKHRTIEMAPTATSINATITPNYRLWGEPPTSDEQRHASRDPLSTLVAMAVDVQRTRTCNSDYPVFDGRFHYRLELRGGDMDRVETDGYSGPALQCSLRYVAVAGYEPTDRGRRRVPQGDVWFALVENAPLAPPVRIRAPLGFSSAMIRATRWREPNVSVEGS
jgi:hypothetical protein